MPPMTRMPRSGLGLRMRRIACSRWSCSGATALAASPKSLARKHWRPTQMRVLGLYHAAEAEISYLSAPVRRALEAYAAGVNAFLAARRGALPPEFVLLALRPEPWRPADSVVWGKLIDLELAGNYRGELLRARLARTVSPDDLVVLYPEYPKDAPTTLAELAGIYHQLPLDSL